MENIKDFIQPYLNKKGWTHKTLAEKIGVAEGTIYNIYKSNDCKLSHLLQILDALDIPYDRFFKTLLHGVSEPITTYRTANDNVKVELIKEKDQRISELSKHVDQLQKVIDHFISTKSTAQ